MGKEYRVILDVPGAVTDKLELAPGPTTGTLLVRVPCRAETVDGQSVRRERGARQEGSVFTRIVPVSWDADAAAARGEIRDGILTITVPKAKGGQEEGSRPEKT